MKKALTHKPEVGLVIAGAQHFLSLRVEVDLQDDRYFGIVRRRLVANGQASVKCLRIIVRREHRLTVLVRRLFLIGMGLRMARGGI